MRGIHEGEFDPIVEELYNEYPALRKFNHKVWRSENRSLEGGGDLEYYHEGEEHPSNVFPDQSNIELSESFFNKGPVDRRDMKKAIFGEMLHSLSASDDPYWKILRQDYYNQFSPEDRLIDEHAYEGSGDRRSYSKWMDVSRMDAYIRGALTDDPEWTFDNPNQKRILDKMKHHLRREPSMRHTSPHRFIEREGDVLWDQKLGREATPNDVDEYEQLKRFESGTEVGPI